MKRLSLSLLIGLLATALVVPASVAAQPARNSLLSGIPVVGTLTDGGTFDGTLTIDSITRSGTDLLFGGNLTGTAVPASGPNAGQAVPVDVDFSGVIGDLLGAGQGKCDILFLELGPIDLDLLGLIVNLSQITLNVDAQPGPGNLLGNLLCAVAGLLDGGPAAGLNNLLRLINRILG